MKAAVDVSVTIVILAFMTVFGFSYVLASLNTQQAQNYHKAVVQELEASNYSQDVIDRVTGVSSENHDYVVKVEKRYVVNTGRPYAKVTLQYRYMIPVLGRSVERDIVGYAR